MSTQQRFVVSETKAPRNRSAALTAARNRTNNSHLRDLVEVLLEHPEGLRRWSVMHAMRTRRERSGREVSQKFEDEVERAFRDRCAMELATPMSHDRGVLFYKPKERAGEVWAVIPERAGEWLKSIRSDG